MSKGKKLLTITFIFAFAVSLLTAFNGYSAKADETVTETNVAMRVGASVRIEEPAGIRFRGEVNEKYFTDGVLNENYTVGMLIIPSQLLEGELTVENEKAENKQVEKFDLNATEDVSDGMVAFNVAMVDVPEKYYTTELTARAYVYDGENYEYSAAENMQTRSIGQVASIALSKGRTDALLTEIVNSCNPSFTIADSEEDEVNITAKIGDTISVTATPANFIVKVDFDGDALSYDSKNVITVSGYSGEVVTARVSLGDVEKTLNVTISDDRVNDELAGITLSDKSEQFDIGYTFDETILPEGANVALRVTATNEIKGNPTTTLTFDKQLTAGRLYTVEFFVRKLVSEGEKLPDFSWCAYFVDNTDGYKTSGKAIHDLYSKKTNDDYRISYTVSATEDMNAYIMKVLFAPYNYTNYDFLIYNVRLKDTTNVSGAAISTVAANMSVEVVSENDNSFIKISGGENVAAGSEIKAITVVNAEENKNYSITFDYTVLKADTSNYWGLYFRTNYSSNTNFINTSGVSQSTCDTIKNNSTFVGKTFGMRLDFTATGSEKIALIFLTHGTMFTNFEFKVENIIVKERTGLLDLLQYKDGSMDAIAASSSNSYGLKYTNDSSMLVTGDDVGIYFEKKGEAGDSNTAAIFKLNHTWTEKTTYVISYKVIDTGIYSSGGNRWWVGFGLVGEKIGGTLDTCSLQYLKNNTDFVSEEIVNGKTVYTITCKYTATKTIENPRFQLVLIGSSLQSFVFTGFNISEVA